MYNLHLHLEFLKIHKFSNYILLIHLGLIEVGEPFSILILGNMVVQDVLISFPY